ncbi:MAG: FGGY-family carbohydrate kinase [Bacilli bacterium]|nr:FGGY-family carbohydrate kinase [Bacilli bacterium]
MSNPLILTFDCGTQSTRALLVDKKGNVVAKEQEKFAPYYSTKPGYAEQHPSVYWNALVKVSKLIHEHNPELVKEIKAVTVTTIRDTFVCVDKNIEPLRDIMVWLDQRAAKCEEPLPTKSRLSFSLVGMLEALEDQRKITKSNWIIENEPEIWAKTYKYISYSSLLVYRLIGELVDSYASQVGHIPFDYKNKCWQKPNNIQFPVFKVAEDQLIPLKSPGEVLGYITKKASELTGIKEGLPLIATGSDKECETLGVGVYDNSMAALSFGTSATVQMSMKDYVSPETFLPAYPGVVKDIYNPEVQVFRGYWMVSWFKQEFANREVLEANKKGCAPEDILNQELKQIPPGSDGLLLQPYWSPALKTPEAKGCIIGFGSEHSRAHIYRAIIEGIGYALLDGLRRLEKRSKRTVTSIAVGGGGSQSDEICQITADMFGVPVMRIQTYEACGVGSSMVAFVALNEFKDFDEAIKSMVHYQKPFLPDAKVHEFYERTFSEIYTHIYPSLKPLYRKIREISTSYKKGE